MTPQELKNSILQLAIQGKLVEQRPEEGTAEELYRQIQEEKQKLIKEGKIKKGKLLPEITEDEIPFEIPSNWIFIRAGKICQLLDGEKREGEIYPYLEARYLRGKTNATFLDKGKYVCSGSKVILVDGENSGEVFEITENGYMGSTFKVLFISQSVCFKYVLYFLKLNQKKLRNNKKGAAIPHLNKEIFFNLVLPLPPLAEQKRIVAKIEELLPYIDRYEKAWSRLEDLNKRFPVDMQKSILQMAIQGKLVEQRPEEGTAEELYKQIQSEKKELIKAGKIKKEKPLPEITEDEIPFDIPESWKWVRMGNFAQLVTKGSSPRWQGIQYVEEGLLFVTSENVGINSLILENKKYVEERFNELSPRSQLSKGDLLTNIVGASIGRTAVYNLDEPANINQAVCLIRLVNSDLLQYILMYMNSATAYNIMMSDKVDTARANISLTNISNFIIPIPPLAEQKRIIAKLAEILPLCRNLK